jgi:hypothetical protein
VLFTPAAALPAWNVRARLGVELQPAAASVPFARPVLDLELGLPAGFTLVAGLNRVGATPAPDRAGDNPGAYGQLRWQFLGRGRTQGFFGGVAVAVKSGDYRGTNPEVQTSVALQYRGARVEVGLEGAFGQVLDGAGSSAEARVFAAYRVMPNLALGVAGQLRGEIGEDDDERAREARCAADPRGAGCTVDLDVIVGATASYTWERWQLGVLVGASTVGIARFDQFNAGFYGQATGAVRF